MLDLEYSADKSRESRTVSRGLTTESRRRRIEDSCLQQRKENCHPTSISRNSSDISTSKSYIMAMKSLQSKLEERDRRIAELEAQLESNIQVWDEQPAARTRHTATFGANDRRLEDVRPRVEPVNLERHLGAGRSQERSHVMMTQSIESEHSIARLAKGSVCRCSEMDAVLGREEEANREVELLRKKLQNQKEQCEQLQSSLDDANRQAVIMETSISKKDKELKSLNAAVKNMQDLVNIISKKKKDASPGGVSLDLSNLISRDPSKKNTESVISLARYSEDECGTTRDHKEISKASTNATNSSETVFSEILTDITQHVLLCEELTFEHLDLFFHMRAKLIEQKDSFKQLEDNNLFLKKTRAVLVEESKVGTFNQTNEKNDVTRKMLEDIETIDCLISLTRGLISVKQ